MSAPIASPIPAGVALGGVLLIDTAWPAMIARCTQAGAVCVAVEWRTALTHLVPNEATYHTLQGHCDFYRIPRVTADHYERTATHG